MIDDAYKLVQGESRIAVVGDCLIDRYYNGKVSRISPEYPLPIISSTGG